MGRMKEQETTTYPVLSMRARALGNWLDVVKRVVYTPRLKPRSSNVASEGRVFVISSDPLNAEYSNTCHPARLNPVGPASSISTRRVLSVT